MDVTALMEMAVYSGFLGFIGREIYRMRGELSKIGEILRSHESRLERIERGE